MSYAPPGSNMSAPLNAPTKPILIGRSSSHFTRVTRIFATEVRVDYSFQIVLDIMSFNSDDFGGNPALKVPTLQTSRGAWFGALNICRELWRQSSDRPRTVWPEELEEPLLVNAQELIVQAMTTEVSLVMSKLADKGADNAHHGKMRKSLLNIMSWLEDNVRQVLAALPSNRELSYLEVTLFCLITHLEFRKVLPVDPYAELNRFCRQFAERASAGETAYRFDA